MIEGGASMPDVEAELGRIPWVLVAPAGSPPRRARPRPLDDGRARAPGRHRPPRARQPRGRRARARAQRARRRGRGSRRSPGELALVPLSLAGRGAATATDVPPILVLAVGVRASARPDAARAFVESLASGPGNAAFRGCGREASR